MLGLYSLGFGSAGRCRCLPLLVSCGRRSCCTFVGDSRAMMHAEKAVAPFTTWCTVCESCSLDLQGPAWAAGHFASLAHGIRRSGNACWLCACMLLWLCMPFTELCSAFRACDGQEGERAACGQSTVLAVQEGHETESGDERKRSISPRCAGWRWG